MKKYLAIFAVMFTVILSSCSIFEKIGDSGAGKKEVPASASTQVKKIRISRPKAVSATADENDNVTVYSSIYNNTEKTVTVTATLSVDGKVAEKKYTIPAKQSMRISKVVKITVEKTVRATVSLSTGEKASSNILCKPYF